VRAALLAAAAACLACGAGPAEGPPLDEGALWGPVAPLERALTFARLEGPDGPELLLVRGVEGDHALAVPLPEADDPIALLERSDAAALRARAAGAAPVPVPLAALGVPAALGAVHVAAGANFRAHGDEVGVEEPFLFPKPVAPTAWASPVPAAARLDYEVELCFVALQPLASAAEAPGRFGVLLCNDFTDRWTLMKGLLGPGEMGTRGFADGKGRPGFLPVGAFLVVPDDLDAFLASVTLELWVNGRRRQHAAATDMIWDLPALVAQSFAGRERAYRHAGGTRSILPRPDGIPARALVLSGTPGGVIFAPSNVWRGGLYLQPGDEVVARADGLGALRNRVAPEAEGAR
jgi:2-keto-4-pentenoate hydratase/2-oxohepta-3-ene-1,7-dioic acid hydratase in catechol pathway